MGPPNTNLCSYYNILAPATINSYNIGFDEFIPFTAGDGFTGNEYHYDLGDLTGGGPDGPWFLPINDGQNFWIPSAGIFQFNARVYNSEPNAKAGLAAGWIGNATLSSPDFSFGTMVTRDLNGNGNVVTFLGGNLQVTVTTPYSASYASPPTLWNSGTNIVTFPIGDTMPSFCGTTPCHPIMNRIINSTDITTTLTAGAPGWASTFQTNVEALLPTGSTNLLTVLWGSNGYTGSSLTTCPTASSSCFSSSAFAGMDLVLFLQCASGTPPTPNIVSSCPLCSYPTTKTSDPSCAATGKTITATSASTCVELSFAPSSPPNC
jgi:hypothetical protein